MLQITNILVGSLPDIFDTANGTFTLPDTETDK